MLETLSALAGAGATALIGAMATDGWEVAKRRFARLLGRGSDDRTAVLAERLEQTRAAVEAAGPQMDRVQAEQRAAWTARLEDLLTDKPEAADELRALLTQLGATTGSASAGAVTQHVVGLDHARQAVQGHGQQVSVFGPPSGPDDARR